MLWYEFVGNVLLFLSLPVVKLFQLILLILRLVLSPFIYLGQLVLRFSMIPIKIVAKLEVLQFLKNFLSSANIRSLCGTT